MTRRVCQIHTLTINKLYFIPERAVSESAETGSGSNLGVEGFVFPFHVFLQQPRFIPSLSFILRRPTDTHTRIKHESWNSVQ